MNAKCMLPWVEGKTAVGSSLRGLTLISFFAVVSSLLYHKIKIVISVKALQFFKCFELYDF